MKKLNFSIEIDAPREKVWNVLWTDETYRKWTSVFCEGSYVETDWAEGGKALFLSPGGNGMYSEIAKNTQNEYMSFRHIGNVVNGKEQPVDAATETWTGAMENYTLREKDGKTELLVDMDITEDHAAMFSDMLPRGLQIVKELAEG